MNSSNVDTEAQNAVEKKRLIDAKDDEGITALMKGEFGTDIFTRESSGSSIITRQSEHVAEITEPYRSQHARTASTKSSSSSWTRRRAWMPRTTRDVRCGHDWKVGSVRRLRRPTRGHLHHD